MRTKADFLTKLNEEGYYNGGKASDYDAFITMCVGGRGIGKTFYYKTMLTYEYLTKKSQWMYLRRTQTELDEIDKESFVTEKTWEIIFYEYEIIEQKTNKLGTTILLEGDGEQYEIMYSSRNMLINKRICCYMKSLSTWAKLKGSEYDKVNNILFDEVLIDLSSNRNYLPNEVEALIQLVVSVFRNRQNVKLYLLSNATNFNNPYFNYFEFRGDNNKRYWFLRNQRVLIEFPEDSRMTQELNPNLYAFAKKSKVFASNVHNEFQEKLTGNIGKIKGNKSRLYSLYCEGNYITAYSTDKGLYMAAGHDCNLATYTFNIKEVERGHIFLNRGDAIPRHIRSNFYVNNIWYDTTETKNAFLNTIQGIL